MANERLRDETRSFLQGEFSRTLQEAATQDATGNTDAARERVRQAARIDAAIGSISRLYGEIDGQIRELGLPVIPVDIFSSPAPPVESEVKPPSPAAAVNTPEAKPARPPSEPKRTVKRGVDFDFPDGYHTLLPGNVSADLIRHMLEAGRPLNTSEISIRLRGKSNRQIDQVTLGLIRRVGKSLEKGAWRIESDHVSGGDKSKGIKAKHTLVRLGSENSTPLQSSQQTQTQVTQETGRVVDTKGRAPQASRAHTDKRNKEKILQQNEKPLGSRNIAIYANSLEGNDTRTNYRYTKRRDIVIASYPDKLDGLSEKDRGYKIHSLGGAVYLATIGNGRLKNFAHDPLVEDSVLTDFLTGYAKQNPVYSNTSPRDMARMILRELPFPSSTEAKKAPAPPTQEVETKQEPDLGNDLSATVDSPAQPEPGADNGTRPSYRAPGWRGGSDYFFPGHLKRGDARPGASLEAIEKQILQLIAMGLEESQIINKLHMTTGRARFLRNRIYEKLGCGNNIHEAIAAALRAGEIKASSIIDSKKFKKPTASDRQLLDMLTADENLSLNTQALADKYGRDRGEFELEIKAALARYNLANRAQVIAYMYFLRQPAMT